MGARKQLTFFDEPASWASPCPNSTSKFASTFVYLLDKGILLQFSFLICIYLIRFVTGGAENHQVYLYDLKDGKSTLLSDGTHKYGSVVWNNAGTRYLSILGQ